MSIVQVVLINESRGEVGGGGGGGGSDDDKERGWRVDFKIQGMKERQTLI